MKNSEHKEISEALSYLKNLRIDMLLKNKVTFDY